ncbi:hypothetical protein GW17_00047996 [Ensete ventricosum]|nr:hypothetical protein GW17_00047996 [Ensete ventricosum]
MSQTLLPSLAAVAARHSSLSLLFAVVVAVAALRRCRCRCSPLPLPLSLLLLVAVAFAALGKQLSRSQPPGLFIVNSIMLTYC